MATFGPTLRRTREARGISLDDIANETRLSKRYILALEDEAIGKLPGGTYNRAYLRTYAAFLGLDPESLLRDYASEEARQLQSAEDDQLAAMNRAIEKRALSSEASGDTRLSGAAVKMVGLAAAAIIVLGLAGGGAWYGISHYRRATASVEADRGEPATAVAVAEPIRPAAPPLGDNRTTTVAAAPASTPPPASAAAPPAPTEVPPTASLPAAAASQPAATVTEPATVSISAAAPVTALSAQAAVSDSANAPRVVTVTHESTLSGDASHLSVADSGVGTAIIDKQLVGQSDRFAVGSKVVFWTHVRGGRAGDTIDHVWFRDGVIVGAASLSVGSPDWRTQSRRLLDPSGVWVVEARDSEGHVLARHQFRAEDTAAQ